MQTAASRSAATSVAEIDFYYKRLHYQRASYLLKESISSIEPKLRLLSSFTAFCFPSSSHIPRSPQFPLNFSLAKCLFSQYQLFYTNHYLCPSFSPTLYHNQVIFLILYSYQEAIPLAFCCPNLKYPCPTSS